MPRWQPRPTIDDKKKTGDDEQLRVLWAVHASVIGHKKVIGSEADRQRKEFSRAHLAGLREGLRQMLGEELRLGTKRETLYANASKLPDPVVQDDDSEDEPPEPHPDPYVQLRKTQQMLGDISKALGSEYHPFVVNLALFDFRTATGGRARKSTHVLNSGADNHYTRPFRDGLPYFAGFLLKALVGARTPPPASTVVTLAPGAGYLPPTRFTATFPLALTGTHPDSTKNPKVLSDPQVPGTTPAPSARYAFLGSFGFSEPSYCTWTETPGTYESGGTRLSVGAYSLDAAYLTQILSLWEKLGAQHQKLYAQYGSVGVKHLKTLQTKFAGGAGHQLGLTWIFQMVDLARALNQKALKSPLSSKGKHLANFLEFVQTRIDTRELKLLEIQKQGLGGKPHLFEYLWVFESTLWELALLSATCLSMTDFASALRSAVPGWEPTVSLSETQLEETLKAGKSTFQRYYFPSGSAAAEELYEILWKTEFAPFGLEVITEELSTFTPYFEFYQSSATLLHRETIRERARQEPLYKSDGTQIWLNLSDGLHSAILDSLSSRPNAGAMIAVLASSYIQQLIHKREQQKAQDPTTNLQRVCLVIDFTKFSGDMPNDRLYPLLAQFRETMLTISGRQRAKVVDVVFLRSNLKYNTGSLDRYQSGEILVAEGGYLSKKGIKASLTSKVTAAFKGEWRLCGEYIPLMKRTYLLADAIGFGRWTAYSQTWEGVRPSPARTSLCDVGLLSLQAYLVGFIEYPLEPIFVPLVNDLPKQSFKPHVSPKTRELITTLWTRLHKDKEYLKDLGWKESGASTPRMRELVSELPKGLNAIISGLDSDLHPGGKPKPKLERTEAYEHLKSYLARLKAARDKLPSLDDRIPQPVSTPSVSGPSTARRVTPGLTSLAGMHCSGCNTVHGRLPSLVRRWHVCRDCSAIFCWWCGFKLKLYEYPSLGEFLDSMDHYTNPGVRACSFCKGPTELA